MLAEKYALQGKNELASQFYQSTIKEFYDHKMFLDGVLVQRWAGEFYFSIDDCNREPLPSKSTRSV